MRLGVLLVASPALAALPGSDAARVEGTTSTGDIGLYNVELVQACPAVI